MGSMATKTMPLGAASALTFFYALGYPVGSACGFGYVSHGGAGVPLRACGRDPGGLGSPREARAGRQARTLTHVLISGLLAQGVLFTCLYVALMHGAPAVLGAVIISTNPVVTALLAAMFLGEGLTWMRAGALVLGVLAVLASWRGTASGGRRS